MDDELEPEEPVEDQPPEEVLDVELGPEDEEEILDVVVDESTEPPACPEAFAPPADASPGGKPGSAQPSSAQLGVVLPAVEEPLPPVDATVVEEAEAERLEAACAYTRQPFLVLAKECGKGAYKIIGTVPLPPGTQIGQPAGIGRQLQGAFFFDSYEGCPHCGAGGLILCRACGVISCGATDPKSGQFLPCPGCGTKGPVVSEAAWSVSSLGQGKGKSGW